MVNINNLTFGYGKKKLLFHKLNLEMTPGNIYGLLGKNGAGKTTLLKNIGGLLYPQEGECMVLGELSSKRIPGILQDIFFVPEEFALPNLTISQYVDIYAPFYPSFDLTKLKEIMDEFHIEDGRIQTFSFGQKKKFLLAFALASKTKLLILDEPTNALDIPSKSQFRKIVASTVDEEQVIIVSTHQVRDLESLIDPILILDEGHVVFQHTCEEVSGKLVFHTLDEDETEKYEKDILYVEKTLAGNHVIMKNTTGRETKINLELLFNAVNENREQLLNVFNN